MYNMRKSLFVDHNAVNGGYIEKDSNGKVRVEYKVDRDGCLIEVPVYDNPQIQIVAKEAEDL